MQSISLPPNLQLSSFKFGQLSIQINPSQIQQLNVKSIKFQFLGGQSKVYELQSKSPKIMFQFDITTTLWHFYYYLKDMNRINVRFICRNGQQLVCQRKLVLIDQVKIINNTYTKGNYITNSIQLTDIFNQKQQNQAYLMIKVKLQFDQKLHQQISDIVDFQALLNNPQSNEHQSTRTVTNKFLNQKQKYRQNQLNYQNIKINSGFQTKISNQQQSRLVQDDIDRMIAQMQNKPYDSSRYLQQSNFSNANSFSRTQITPSIPPSRPNFHLNHSNSLNPAPYGAQQTSHRQSHSPHPPRPYQPNSTQMSKRSISPLNHSQSKSNHSQIMYQTMNSRISASQAMQGSKANQGTLKIHVHQLMTNDSSQLEGLVLKVYFNTDHQQLFTAKGSLQGQVILYNQKTDVAHINLCNIQHIRFQLENWNTEVLFSAIFQMNRLINIPKLQGIFMLNLHPNKQEYYGNSMMASQSILKRVQKLPSQKTLRISLSFLQQIQILQLYIRLQHFNFSFTSCKYKIPFTKQTVQFSPTLSHSNIFPHSKSSLSKLVLEFWQDNKIKGISQINFNNIKTMTKAILECNVQPVCLFDQLINVGGLLNTKEQVGKVKLLLCCGNVRQIQHLLNKNLKQSQYVQFHPKTQVQVDYNQKLGIYIKDRKPIQPKQQIQIQVNTDDLISKENHEVSVLSQNQFLKSNSGQSRFHTMQLNQQQDVEDQQYEQEQQKAVVKQEPIKLVPIDKKIDNKGQSYKQKAKPTVIQMPIIKQKPAIAQQNLTQFLCSSIKKTLHCLCLNNFSPFKQLKSLCKPHLLFNFIQIQIFISKLLAVNVSTINIHQIMQILQPKNNMVNFNFINDLIFSVEVEGRVKENLISDHIFIQFALEHYYHRNCIKILLKQQQWHQYLVNKVQPATNSSWLNKQILNQISTLDQSIDFNQMRSLYFQINYKLSMSEYNILKNFLENQSSIITFLQDISSNKQNQLKKTNLFQLLKLTIIQNIINKKCQEQLNKKYQENVLQKIYANNNQSMISSRISQKYQQTDQLANLYNQYDNDDDDFIINGLNAKQPILTQTKTISQILVQKKQAPIKEQSMKKKEVCQIKPVTQSSISKKMCTIQVGGLQSCCSTYECQIDSTLNLPFIKIHILSPFEKLLFFKQSDPIQQQFQSLLNQDQQIQGQIELIHFQNNQEVTVAMARFVIIRGVKSVYAMKTMREDVFCGLVNVQIN